jgi:hypothetical protein
MRLRQPNFFIDAEMDLGIVPYSTSAAAANTTKLNNALAAMWKGGAVTLPSGEVTNILKPIFFHGKEYFFSGPIITSTRLGCSLIGCGSRPYYMGSNQYDSASLGGMRTQFTRIDGNNGGAVIRLRGQGTLIQGIVISGRQYSTENGVTGPTEGTATPIGIEVEGRAAPATGGHILRDVMVAACTYGIALRHGYHDSGTTRVHPGIDGLYDLAYDENHGEAGVMENVTFWECDNCFYSENNQAVLWRGRSLRVGAFSKQELTVFNIVRGGNHLIEGLELMVTKPTVLSVHRSSANWPSYNDGGTWKYKFNDTACPSNNPDPHDYSPYTPTFTLLDLKWDHFAAELSPYITLFKYAGPNYLNYDGMQSFQWNVRMTGHLAMNPLPYWGGSPEYDSSKLIDINDGGNTYFVPRDCLLFDILNLPTTNFTRLGDGPWWYPTPPSYPGLTISSGAITVTKPFHTVDTESAASSDDLDTINGGRAGHTLILRAHNSARTVVAKNGTGNIKLAGSDFSLDNSDDTLVLFHNGTNWLELSRANNGA